MAWTYSRDPCGGWYWHHPELPNGWAPSISDWSQSIAPIQPTKYRISAISKHQIMQGDEFDALEQAKREAILFAMQQRDAEQVYAEAIAALVGAAPPESS